MYQVLKDLPLVIDLRKILFELKFSNHENVNYFRGVFKNFEEAARSSPRTKPIGYDNKPAAKLYRERLYRIHSTDYPVLFWFNKYQDEIETVFDFGGHVGIHYFSYTKVLNSIKNIKRWTVCDVASVTEEGKKYATARDCKNLDFVNDSKTCENYDLFFASGSLQYVDWELHDLIRSLNVPPKFIIMNMLPLHKEHRTVTLQSIGASFCPYLIRKEKDFIAGLESLGYELIDRWVNEEKKCSIAFESKRSLDHYQGLFFKLKK